MTTRSSMLHVWMDTALKLRAVAALAAMGLTASEAVRPLLHRITVDQAFPLLRILDKAPKIALRVLG